MSAKDDARELHADAMSWDPRRQGEPEYEAQKAAMARLRVLEEQHARSGRGLLDWAPDELAHKVESMAHVIRAGRWSDRTEDWASLAAVCLAGWCAAARAEELSSTSGEAA